jgi:hypothetical protein
VYEDFVVDIVEMQIAEASAFKFRHSTIPSGGGTLLFKRPNHGYVTQLSMGASIIFGLSRCPQSLCQKKLCRFFVCYILNLKRKSNIDLLSHVTI